VESAKWSSWKSLGDLHYLEAMRLYVRALEQDNPDWWALATAGGTPELAAKVAAEAAAAAAAAAASAAALAKAAATARAAGAGGAAGAAGATGGACARGLAAMDVAQGQWQLVPAVGERPRRRYEHAAALLGGRLLVSAGNANGRALGDAHALDLRTLAWSRLDLHNVAPAAAAAAPDDATAAAAAASSAPEEDAATAAIPILPGPCPLPLRAGHAAVPWEDKLLLVGGHVKGAAPDAPLDVLTLAPDGTWSRLATTGVAPVARGGHSAALIHERLWVFGGDDARRRPLGDVSCLDLRTLAWREVVTGGAHPAPRTCHVAAAHGGCLFVFGGMLASGECTASLAVLDTATCTWHAPHVAGAPPPPRAGGAGAVLGGVWYVAGGGDGAGPRRETLAMRLPERAADLISAKKPLRWRAAASVSPRSPLAAEGLSMLALPEEGALLAFGGYNGAYFNDVSLLKPTLLEDDADDADADAGGAQQAAPAAAAAAAAALAAPDAAEAAAAASAPRASLPTAATAAAAAPPPPPPSTPRPSLVMEAVPPAAGEAAAIASAELTLMRRQLTTAQSSLAEAEASLAAAASLRAQLEAEQIRAVRAEAEAAELRVALAAAQQTIADLSAQAARHKADADAADAAAAAAAVVAPPAKRGGFLSYVTGQ
jgi:hypothetical protein